MVWQSDLLAAQGGRLPRAAFRLDVNRSPMQLIPDWAPGVHPQLVHFPIALLFTAAVVDMLALVFRKRLPGLEAVGTGLYVLGAAGLVASFYSGRAAADGLYLSAAVAGAVDAHSDLAKWTSWGYGLYAIFRLIPNRSRGLSMKVGVSLVGVVGLGLVHQTAERGARLVYDLGIGVRAVQAGSEGGMVNPEAQPMPTRSATSGADADSSNTAPQSPAAWRWSARDTGLPNDLRFLQGAPDDLGETRRGLRLGPAGRVMFTTQEFWDGVEVRARLYLMGFRGRVAIVHHVRDERNYDYLALSVDSGSTTAEQGRVVAGVAEVFDRKTVGGFGDEVVTLHLVAQGSHFRGYLDEELLTHGHGTVAAPGTAGLLIEARTPLGLLGLDVVPITD